ncbi:hypothetical protein R5R35_002575 [Gryllus longicercus]|uniref:Uncharacterized protein n=1 Tax=Gryllus longicercus TaxID=2509291 RepID=A0AAN9VPL4_9ORTH
MATRNMKSRATPKNAVACAEVNFFFYLANVLHLRDPKPTREIIQKTVQRASRKPMLFCSVLSNKKYGCRKYCLSSFFVFVFRLTLTLFIPRSTTAFRKSPLELAWCSVASERVCGWNTVVWSRVVRFLFPLPSTLKLIRCSRGS